MSAIQPFLEKYGESHQNATNKAIHWLCVPAIMFSLFGLLYSIPFFVERSLFYNWAAVVFAAALVYYLRLSVVMFIGFLFVGFGLLYGNHILAQSLAAQGISLWVASLIIFVVAWIGQFISHKIEGKKPSFLEDVQYLLIGPAWLLHFIFNKVGIKY
jgi:uncharacterized membrane protein YGL010W